jgi:hypothetical protein
MMDNDLDGVESNTADDAVEETQGFDNLDDALDALEDDTEEREQPATEDDADEETAETDEEEAEETEAGADEVDSGDETVYQLPDGEEITLSEIADLKANGLRAQDYTHKTTELAEGRKALETDREAVSERANSINQLSQNLGKYLETIIPAEPSLQLAQTDPAAYQYEKAIREQAIAELTNFQGMQAQAGEQVSGISQENIDRFKQTQNDLLIKEMPALADPVKRKAFDDANRETALKLGFEEAEIQQTSDNRILRAIHYANIGLRAEHNAKNAKRRVQTPMKKSAPRGKPVASSKNAQAMRSLSKSGSINDAMNIDFD